jgi:hypothetical protein
MENITNCYSALLFLSTGEYTEKMVNASTPDEAKNLVIKEVNSEEIRVVGTSITPLVINQVFNGGLK